MFRFFRSVRPRSFRKKTSNQGEDEASEESSVSHVASLRCHNVAVDEDAEQLFDQTRLLSVDPDAVQCEDEDGRVWLDPAAQDDGAASRSQHIGDDVETTTKKKEDEEKRLRRARRNFSEPSTVQGVSSYTSGQGGKAQGDRARGPSFTTTAVNMRGFLKYQERLTTYLQGGVHDAPPALPSNDQPLPVGRCSSSNHKDPPQSGGVESAPPQHLPLRRCVSASVLDVRRWRVSVECQENLWEPEEEPDVVGATVGGVGGVDREAGEAGKMRAWSMDATPGGALEAAEEAAARSKSEADAEEWWADSAGLPESSEAAPDADEDDDYHVDASSPLAGASLPRHPGTSPVDVGDGREVVEHKARPTELEKSVSLPSGAEWRADAPSSRETASAESMSSSVKVLGQEPSVEDWFNMFPVTPVPVIPPSSPSPTPYPPGASHLASALRPTQSHTFQMEGQGHASGRFSGSAAMLSRRATMDSAHSPSLTNQYPAVHGSRLSHSHPLAQARQARNSDALKAAEVSRFIALISWLMAELRIMLEVPESWPVLGHEDEEDEMQKDIPLEEELLGEINAAVITAIDSAPERRLLRCMEPAGWDHSIGGFPPETTERQLEVMGQHLMDLLAVLTREKEDNDAVSRRQRLARGRRSDSYRGSATDNNRMSAMSSGVSESGDSTSSSVQRTESHASMRNGDAAAARTLSVPDAAGPEPHGVRPQLRSNSKRTISRDLLDIIKLAHDKDEDPSASEASGAPSAAVHGASSQPSSQRLTATFSGLSTGSMNKFSDDRSDVGSDVVSNIPANSNAAAQQPAAEQPVFSQEIVQGITHTVGSYEISFEELVFDKGYPGAHNRLGIGGYGEVFLASWHGTPVAVKRLLEQDMNSGVVFREFKAEVGILSKLRHNNIVMWLGACTKPPNMAVVLEALYSQTSIGPRGRSLSYLLHKTNVQISRLQVLLWLEGVVKGMLYLHSRSVIHCDLNTNNVLIGNDNVAKITDFGLSRVKVQSRLSNNPAQTGVGTVNTTAPEVLRGDAFDGKKADTFSFGVMLWELVTRRIPWTDWKPLRVYANLVAHGCEHVKRELVFPNNTPVPWVQLAMDCWCDDPRSRPSMDKILVRIRKMVETERREVHRLENARCA